jgi:hypothetical protein
VGVYLFVAFTAALGVGALVIRFDAATKVLIAVSFLLSVVGALTAMDLSSTPFHWQGPAFGDALAFAVVGFQLMQGIEEPEKPKKHFKTLVYSNALGGVVLATVYAVWRVYHFLTPVWVTWTVVLAAFALWLCFKRLYKKLNEGIEPFGPSSRMSA